MSEFEIMGQDAVSGVGYIPNFTNLFQNEMMLFSTDLPYRTGSSGTTQSTLSALNDYFAFIIIPYRDLTVNRVMFRVSTISSPSGIVVTGGIATYNTTTGNPTQSGSAISFLGSGTVSSFTANTTYTISLGADVTLTAGTKYFIAFQITSRTSGSITVARVWALNNSYLATAAFPRGSTRIAGTETKSSGGVWAVSHGYNDGVKTIWYRPLFISYATYQLNRSTSPIYKEVGSKFAIKYDLQEIIINAINVMLQISSTATSSILTMKIYDSDGQSVIATSSMANGDFAVQDVPRYCSFYFEDNVRLIPYKYYYFMISDSAAAGTINFISYLGCETSNDSDFENIAVTRTTLGGAITEQSTTRLIFSFHIVDIKYKPNVCGQSGM